MSVLKASVALGMSRHRVLAATARGELESACIAERVVISRASVNALLAARAESQSAAS